LVPVGEVILARTNDKWLDRLHEMGQPTISILGPIIAAVSLKWVRIQKRDLRIN
jgi:hypothetical protein